MKRKLSDNEVDAVSGGWSSCTTEQAAKLQKGRCPFCNGSIEYTWKTAYEKGAKCTPCNKIYRHSLDTWQIENGSSGGC